MEMMLDKKQMWTMFLYKFKIGHKAVKTTQNNNKVFSPETANEHMVQWWFKKFCKADENLEDEEHSGQPLEVDDDNWENHQSWFSYKYMRSYPRIQCQSFYGRLAFEVNWKGERAWWLSASWADHKSKKSTFLSVIFSFCATIMNRFSVGLWRAMKSAFYTTMGNDQPGPRRSSKALPRAKLATKNVMVTVW